MDQRARPFRSVLYIPGSKERALEKAQGLTVDAIIFDLEDAVAMEEKANARTLLVRTLSEADFGRRAKIVRINGRRYLVRVVPGNLNGPRNSDPIHFELMAGSDRMREVYRATVADHPECNRGTGN